MKQYDWPKTLNSSHIHQRPTHQISNCNHLHNCLLLTAKKQLQSFHTFSPFLTIIQYPYCQSIYPLHTIVSSFEPLLGLVLKVTICLMFTNCSSVDVSLVILVVKRSFFSRSSGGAQTNNIPCIHACLPVCLSYIWKSVLLEIKSLAHIFLSLM